MMREAPVLRWKWVIAHNAMGVGFVGSLLWLRADFLPTIGGGAAIVLLGMTGEWLRLQILGKDNSSSLLRFVVLGYLVMSLNLAIGLAKHSGWVLPWVLLAPLLTVVSVGLCAGVAEAYLPFEPPYRKEPRASQAVVAGLLFPVILAILSQSLVLVEPVRTRIDLGILSVGTIFVCSILTGTIAILGIRDYRASPPYRVAAGRMLLASPLWLMTGSIAELLRGSWIVWLLSAASLVIVQGWIYILSHRMPPVESVRTQE